jgi:PTH1 family peptidyl-tRNA hydrolase
MHILVFLGNPGKKYQKNRHNIGFIIGNYLADRYSISCTQKKFNAFTGKGKIEASDIVMLFPQTYMNNSGESVSKALTFYQEEIKNCIVIHDEIELSFSDIRLKTGGGHKGHNGLRSIIQHCSSPDFHRIRFGVGRPENPNMDVADYVLSDFNSEEMTKMDNLIAKTESLILDILNKS